MCRIAAYLGPPCPLAHVLTKPAHGLARQSWDAREQVSATVNADGWGAGWYDPAGRPAVYRNTQPIWADGNVDALGRSLHAPLWLANVRSATTGLATGHANTQPFADDRLLFVHNGFIQDFAQSLRARIRCELDPAIETTINGNTDSEYLLALIRQQHGSLTERLTATMTQIQGWVNDVTDLRALLNVIVTDGHELVAVRAAVRAIAPSLYVNHDWHGATVIASEAFDDRPGWQAVKPGQTIVVEDTVPA